MSLRNAVNRGLAATWGSGLLPEPVLDLRAIEAAAERAEPRLGGLGDGTIRAAMETLLASLRDEADLNPLGRTMAWGQLVGLLRQRLRARDLWRRHPEILARPIAAPVLILGQMRSGTTRLHRLLACDPRFSHNRFWEVMSPVPKNGRDWRRAQARLGLQLLGMLNPRLRAIHPTAVDAAEEEFGLFSFSLHGAQLEAQWRIPGFARWSRARDLRPVYREFRMLLQTIGWARADPPDRPLLLKAPQFLEDLDICLDTFPDARLISLHRDPREVVASSASLVWNQMRIQSDSADKASIGAEWLDKTARRERISRRVRAARPLVPRIDIDFEAMNLDWRGEIARIYDFLGLELTPQVERRMRSYLAGAEKSGFRGHAYALEEFGLDADMVERTIGAARAAAI